MHHLGVLGTGLIRVLPQFRQFTGCVDGQISQLLNYFIGAYFPIGILSYVWLGSPFATTGHDHPAQTGCSSSFGHTIIYDVLPPSLSFPGPDYKPNAVCLPVSLNTHSELGEAVLQFTVQTAGQSLVLASAQTSDSMD